MVAIGKGHGACIQQKPDLGHFTPRAALGQGGHRQDMHRGGFAGAADDEFQRFGIVDGRIGVGAGDDGGHTASGGGGTGGAEAFLVTLAGFADLDADVDDAGGQVLSGAVHNVSRAKHFCIFNGLR